MHKNKQKNHVTSDGIRNSETIKSDFKVAKKRARNPDKWKRRKAARLRQGEEYISQKIDKVCKDAFCSLYRIGRKKVIKAQQELKSGKVAP